MRMNVIPTRLWRVFAEPFLSFFSFFFWHLNLFACAVLNPTKVLYKHLASACYNL